ncbi:cupin domain-containing protein [Pontibacter oryzae]|uniref:Cupin domain-containing protein n=1 Tax=Pontibacter oryzae TaxID=2304593 RepID=A0A399RUD4_9BACT|nr:cupin domain-containing protein [Pontibacter oryzae]RIJ34481.1 cupin domain-containing protein [Pontibacter oryzae]
MAAPSILLIAAATLIGCESKATTSKKQDKSASQLEADRGAKPWALDIEEATVDNTNYRITKWTGNTMQMALMSLKPGEVIDLEIHSGIDQFIRVEQGQAQVMMGKTADKLTFSQNVSDDWAIFIPAGYYHQIENVGKEDLKVYTIYAPAEHLKGTVNKTYHDAQKYHDTKHKH